MEKDTLINRKPAVAGTFYPANREELEQKLEKLFSVAKAPKETGKILAVISPHAGYVYSGEVAASSFNQLMPDQIYENIFIIGSSHHASFDGAALYSKGHFVTPLGLARVNLALSEKLIQEHSDVFKSMPDVHFTEHSLEVQIPFLQYLYKENLQIVPIIIGSQKEATIRKIAEALTPYFGLNNLFVISTDFSHYPDYETANSVDKSTADAILSNSPNTFLKVLKENGEKDHRNLATSICGWTSVLTLLEITEKLTDVHYNEIQYMNSGDVPYGDKNRVVGYNAIIVASDINSSKGIVTDSFTLSETEKEKLLRIARFTINEYLRTGKKPEIPAHELSKQLTDPAGAFVTLTKDKELRGCIGHFEADMPLYKTVQEMAISAAVRDYRFSKVTLEELESLHIEISVLSPLRRIQSINEIILGQHGIYIKKGNKGGTFLPQVANQTKWTLEEFLGHCSRDKAGIGWDGWKTAELFIYEAYIFGEH